MKTLIGACATLAVLCALSACGDDYQGGGRQNTLPGAATAEDDAGADTEDPEDETDPPDDDAGSSLVGVMFQ
jgi:hypothetical protein